MAPPASPRRRRPTRPRQGAAPLPGAGAQARGDPPGGCGAGWKSNSNLRRVGWKYLELINHVSRIDG